MQNYSNQDLESIFAELVKTERKITYDVLLYIQEIDKRSLHLALGYGSLAEYLIKKHHYSEGSAFRRISAMRMLTAVPEIKDKIVEGSLNLSQLSMVQTAVMKKQKEDNIKLSNEDKRELLLKIEGQSAAKTQGCLADNLNIDLQEKKQITYGKEDSVYLNLKFTKEEFEKVKECLDRLSHQVSDYKGLILNLSEKILKSKSKDIQKKSTQQQAKQQDSDAQCNFAAKSQSVETRSRFIPAALKKEIFKRDQAKCQFRGLNNRICGSKQFVQVHHIRAFAKGGLNTKENLSLRCRSHNLYEAEIEGLALQ